MLSALSDAADPDGASAHEAFRSTPDRRTAHRFRLFLAKEPPGTAWATAQRRRGVRGGIWIQPGVRDAFLTDPRVVLGGAHALAAAGVDLAPGGRVLAYVREDDVDDLRWHFHFQDAGDGELDLLVIPTDVPPLLTPQGHRRRALPAAAVDLLDDPDARARAAATAWLMSLVGSVLHGTGAPG